MAVDEELLSMIACPRCKGEVKLNKAGDGLVCEECRLVYPVKDDIPVMLADEAIELD
ncbi:MAG: Trm112 family protein [Thermodesulfobacteriota bacterium]